MNTPWTRAAEGLPRRAFSVTEVERMVELGLLAEDERVELVGGELVPMSPKGIHHEVLKRAVLRHWRGSSAPSVDLMLETTFRLSPDTYLEPDLLIVPQAVRTKDLTGPSVVLCVEIADSSLGYDLGRKPLLYAAFGVPELWVIDAVKLRTHVHRQPGNGRYASVAEFAADALLTPELAPELTLRLSDLDLR